MSKDLAGLIADCVREVREQQELEIPDLSSETILFGKSGMFDSVGLVSLVVSAEEAIEDEFGVSVSLADQRAMSQENSPFRTIGALTAYAGKLIEEES